MKKSILFIASLLFILGCAKESSTPDGPSDIRIRNTTNSDFVNVFVDIGDGENEGEHNYGDIVGHGETSYYRFEIAYPDALITLTVGGVEYSTPIPDHTFAVPVQQGKFTYELWISTGTTLAMKVITDAPLDDIK